MTVATQLKPRISLNELGRFLSSSDPLERRKIVKQQKGPNPHVVAYWSDAERIIRDFLLSDMDEEIIIAGLDKLHLHVSDTAQTIAKKKYNIAAVESFLNSYHLISIDGQMHKAPSAGKKVSIAGVDISVRPEVYVVTTRKIGAIKLFFGSREIGISKESADAIATLIYYQLNQQEDAVSPSACGMFDVFNQSFHSSPRTYKRCMHRLEATCDEIRLLWDNI